eukprot:Skav229911  [mRNA]  locus=scaffold877:55323:56321:+ [translate_table: standard]
MWTHFFDDYVAFAPRSLEEATSNAVQLFFRLLGWTIAEDGSKAQGFAESLVALGICIDLSQVDSGCVRFTNTEKRVLELVDTIKGFLEAGFITVADAQKLRGRMQFADGQLFGRVGSLCVRAVTRHAFEHGAGKFDSQCRRALERFSHSLQFSPPRLIKPAEAETWYIFTDASFEPQEPFPFCGLGGVLVDANGRAVSFFSTKLDEGQLRALGWGDRKTVIFEAELLALIAAIVLWEKVILGSLVVCFIDNNSARDVAISAAARNECANLLLDKLVAVEMSSSGYFWFARVPSPSNIADDPSRQKCNDLLSLGAKPIDCQACVASIIAENLG